MSYPRFVRVLERWPVDRAKAGKDLGEAIRTVFARTYPQGSVTVVQEEKVVDRQVAALQRLVDNTHQTCHPLASPSTFTGLGLEQLRQITSVESMAAASEAAEIKPGFLEKLKLTFTRH